MEPLPIDDEGRIGDGDKVLPPPARSSSPAFAVALVALALLAAASVGGGVARERGAAGLAEPLMFVALVSGAVGMVAALIAAGGVRRGA